LPRQTHLAAIKPPPRLYSGNADKDQNAKVDIKITVNGNDVALEFLNIENARVSLKLVSDTELKGDIRILVGKKASNADLDLKKIN
jgi:hypothetical protein